ncbi:MAG TPA: glycyl-radical enzyme activating protein [Myxococcota bacterium]|nr:glycyl-radical enzyme activating protein [Myxococcota bacterium]
MRADPMNGRVFDISRGCVDDGPGLRTTVFFKGCKLDCPWCHNPEGKSFRPEIAFDRGACIGCGECEKACPRDRSPDEWIAGWRAGCKACGKCAEICPSGARRLVGREMSVDELLAELASDLDFFSGTGGGVTFSGGEPLAQPEFLFACAGKLHKIGVHLAVETSGYWPMKYIDKICELFDLVLFDFKQLDPSKCKKFLGVSVREACRNLKCLVEAGMAVEVRITLIPGFNDSSADLAAMAKFLSGQARRPPVRLQAFHRLAASKQDLFARPYPYASFQPVSEKRLAEAALFFS